METIASYAEAFVYVIALTYLALLIFGDYPKAYKPKSDVERQLGRLKESEEVWQRELKRKREELDLLERKIQVLKGGGGHVLPPQ